MASEPTSPWWRRRTATAGFAQLRPHGAELVGELGQYENYYRICYVRGPNGIIVELAEKIT